MGSSFGDVPLVELLASSDAGIEQISLQHGVVLRHDWDHHGRIFRALAFVDGRGVGRNQRVEFAKPVSDAAAVEAGGELAVIGINIVDVADVAVINLLVVVVLDLHSLVAGREGPTEPLDLALSGGGQRRLQFDVERACADAAPVDWAQNLDSPNGVEADAFRDNTHGRGGLDSKGEHDAIRAKKSLSACSNTKYFQLPTPSHLSKNAPSLQDT